VLWGLPYLIGVVVNHDLSFPRYLLPLVALLCPLLALGLPSRAGRARLVTALTTAAMLSVSVPRAQRHGEAPRVGYEVTRFVRESLDPGGDALLITGDGQYLAFFLTRDAPAHVLRIVPLSALSAETERLESEGWRVYATAPAPDQPGAWQPVARLCRGDKPADARDPDEVWIFQHRPGAPRAGFPECS
jgi:hypothetical protein